MWRIEGQRYKRFFPENGAENRKQMVTFVKELYFMCTTPFPLSSHFAPLRNVRYSLKACGPFESFGTYNDVVVTKDTTIHF